MKKVIENLWLIAVVCFFIYLGISTGAWESIVKALFGTWFKVFVLFVVVVLIQIAVNKKRKTQYTNSENIGSPKFKNFIRLEVINIFFKQNWFKVVVILFLLLIYIRINIAFSMIIENNSYIIENLEKIENNLDGFYSDWFKNL